MSLVLQLYLTINNLCQYHSHDSDMPISRKNTDKIFISLI